MRDLSEHITAWVDGGWLAVRSAQVGALLGKQVSVSEKPHNFPADLWGTTDPETIKMMSDQRRLDLARYRQGMFDEIRSKQRAAESWTPCPDVSVSRSGGAVSFSIEDDYEFASVDLTPAQAKWIGERLIKLAEQEASDARH